MFDLSRPGTWIPIVGGVACLALATYVLRRLPRDGRTTSLAGICLGVAVLHLYQWSARAAVDVETAIAIQSFLHGGYALTALSAFHFGMHYTGKGAVARSRPVLGLSALWWAGTTLWISSPIVGREYFALPQGGWYSVYDSTALTFTISGNALLGLSMFGFVAQDLYARWDDPVRRTQNLAVFVGVAITLGVGIPTDVLLPIAGMVDQPRLLSVAFLALLAAMTWALTRNEWLGFSMEAAAETAIERIVDGVVVLDERARVRFANPAFEELMPADGADALVRRLDTVLHAAWSKALQGEATVGTPLQLGGRALRVGLAPLESDRTGRRVVVAVLHDVTEVEAARAAAERADRAKSTFLAKMSHELRTPLNAIIGYSELLAEDVPEASADLSRIESSGRYLLSLINDILDLSKVHAGRLELRAEDVDAAKLARELEDQTRGLFEREGSSLRLRVKGTPHAHGDPIRVRQILLNLLSNAAKFSDGSPVTLTVGIERNTFVASVRDQGIGMDRAQQAALFKSFSQVHRHEHARYGGTGLGLAVSKELARLMEGDLSVQSAPGLGSTFRLELPAGAGGTASPGSPGASPPPG